MTPCPIFYRPEMSAHAESYSPSSSKPQRVIEHWLQQRLVKPEDIRSFEPATRQDLYAAHAPWYVDGVLDLTERNGFGGREPEVAASLPYTTGSMVAAALHVAEHGGFACSPTSGFHHAYHAAGGGFCTFNGLIVAAIQIQAMGKTVGILDCDAHYGNGTQHIINKLYPGEIKHYTMGSRFPCGSKAPKFMPWLFDAIDDLQDCDVVLYQAGADPWENDPLGGQLSMTELAVRDQYVFGGLPNVAWNFAGGYSPAVTSIHTHTLQAAQGKYE